MNPEQRQRLEQLIQFLNRLREEQFYFGAVVRRYSSDHCGSVCCAIGWTPALFPKKVKWDGDFYDYLISADGRGKTLDYAETAEMLFGIPRLIAEDLFAPDNQFAVHPDLDICLASSTPQAVAKMLSQFLKLVDAGEIPMPKNES